MASFSWSSCSIHFDNGGLVTATKADLAQMPYAAQPTLSFVHEYVHFVQQTGSPMGISLIGELVNIAVLGALIINGKVSSQGGSVESQPVFPLLKNLPSGAVATVPELQQRIADLVRDARLMLLPVQLLAITTKRGEMTKRSDQHGARAAVTK
jgi:hypothetical protein